MASLSSSLSKDLLSYAPTFSDSSNGFSKLSFRAPKISAFPWKLSKVEETLLRLRVSVGRDPNSRLETSKEPPELTQGLSNKLGTLAKTSGDLDPFSPLKDRFLEFKRQRFLENSVHFQNLAEIQTPKFLVIACADSRVCPSVILGFQPGEAFTVRNVANLIPPFASGPSETKAALEFAVNSLQVGNILVIGHSRCGGIRALMSMQDEVDSSFIGQWVVVGKSAKVHVKDAAANLSFEHQCRHCEKESINRSMVNLLTYPWIEEKVRKSALSIHGGYYDFVDCTFEKWSLNYKESAEDGNRCSIKDRSFWC